MPSPWTVTFGRYASTFQPRYQPNIWAPVIRAIKMGLLKTLYTGMIKKGLTAMLTCVACTCSLADAAEKPGSDATISLKQGGTSTTVIPRDSLTRINRRQADLKQHVKVPDGWAWIKKYRVWEANRKLFQYPENWLEPELRNDKSKFFAELEEELLRTDPEKSTPEVRAEIIALVLVGRRSHEPREFGAVVKNNMSAAAQYKNRHIIEKPDRWHLREGIRRVVMSALEN